MSRGRLHVIDVTDPYWPQPRAVFHTSESVFSITVSGNLAYVTHLMAGVRILEMRDPTRPQELALVQFSPQDANGGAFGVEVVGGTAYLANAPLRALDVTDPRNPRLIGVMSTPSQPQKLAVVADHLYAAAAFGGFLVYRVRRQEKE